MSPMFWLAFAALVIPNVYALVNWYSRLRTLEETVKQHALKLSIVDSFVERLARIETKLDMLMQERK